jgi:hypothetical protein
MSELCVMPTWVACGMLSASPPFGHTRAIWDWWWYALRLCLRPTYVVRSFCAEASDEGTTPRVFIIGISATAQE